MNISYQPKQSLNFALLQINEYYRKLSYQVFNSKKELVEEKQIVDIRGLIKLDFLEFSPSGVYQVHIFMDEQLNGPFEVIKPR